MVCTSTTCQWITTISQLAVAVVFVYAGLVVNSHMESWTESLEKGANDLTSISMNMNTISYSMESINRDMDVMKMQADEVVTVSSQMELHMHKLVNDINVMTQQMQNINRSVGGIQNNFSPQGMMRSFIPF
jgi:uncharacterized protein YoxC